MVVKLPNTCKQGVCYPGILTTAYFARDCVNIKEHNVCFISMS